MICVERSRLSEMAQFLPVHIFVTANNFYIWIEDSTCCTVNSILLVSLFCHQWPEIYWLKYFSNLLLPNERTFQTGKACTSSIQVCALETPAQKKDLPTGQWRCPRFLCPHPRIFSAHIAMLWVIFVSLTVKLWSLLDCKRRAQYKSMALWRSLKTSLWGKTMLLFSPIIGSTYKITMS